MKQDKAPYVAKAETKKTEYTKTMQKYNMKLVFILLVDLFLSFSDVKPNVMYVSSFFFFVRLMELAQLEMMTLTSPSPKSTMKQKVEVKRFVLHTILKYLCLCLLVS